MQAYQKRQLSEDLYDLIKECALSDVQDDEWAKLSHEHAEDARKNLRNFLRGKNIAWNGDTYTIEIGKHVTISIK